MFLFSCITKLHLLSFGEVDEGKWAKGAWEQSGLFLFVHYTGQGSRACSHLQDLHVDVCVQKCFKGLLLNGKTQSSFPTRAISDAPFSHPSQTLLNLVALSLILCPEMA